jgi:protein involved in polysaccharide export with SLBB domain
LITTSTGLVLVTPFGDVDPVLPDNRLKLPLFGIIEIAGAHIADRRERIQTNKNVSIQMIAIRLLRRGNLILPWLCKFIPSFHILDD